MTKATHFTPEALAVIREVVRREMATVQGGQPPRGMPYQTPRKDIALASGAIGAGSTTSPGSSTDTTLVTFTSGSTEFSAASATQVYNPGAAISAGSVYPVVRDFKSGAFFAVSASGGNPPQFSAYRDNTALQLSSDYLHTTVPLTHYRSTDHGVSLEYSTTTGIVKFLTADWYRLNYFVLVTGTERESDRFHWQADLHLSTSGSTAFTNGLGNSNVIQIIHGVQASCASRELTFQFSTGQQVRIEAWIAEQSTEGGSTAYPGASVIGAELCIAPIG